MFGEIHIEKNKYINKEGLERAIKELKEFERKNNKKPVLKDLGMGGIVNAILRGEWKYYGITSWNDLLKIVFGEIVKEKNKYQGKEGLNRAIKVLKESKRKCGRIPASNSRGIYSIYNNARNGIWKEFGIKN